MKRQLFILGGACAVCLMAVWISLVAKAQSIGSNAAPTTAPTVRMMAQPRYSRSRRGETSSNFVSDRTPQIPNDYAILLSRSMFVRGHIAEAGHVGGRAPINTAPAPEAARQETTLVFNGVTLTQSTVDALVEDTNSGRVMTVHPGDKIANGSVGTITMDTLEYTSPSGRTLVHIGQNFVGGSSDLSSVPTTSGPIPSGASQQDILERLRQKRLQELGGK